MRMCSHKGKERVWWMCTCKRSGSGMFWWLWVGKGAWIDGKSCRGDRVLRGHRGRLGLKAIFGVVFGQGDSVSRSGV